MNGLDDIKISKAIVSAYLDDMLNFMECDVAIAGAGPAGLTAAYYLAKNGAKVAVFERKLSIGGGMWGGGMMFNKIVVSTEATAILDEFGIKYSKYENDYHVADAIEAVASILLSAVKAGAKIFNLISVEDLLIKDSRVNGFVINWSAVGLAGLHVDPITIRAKYCIEATGHPLEVLQTLVKKNDVALNTPSGGIEGERSMDAAIGERMVLENTKEIYPGLWVVGMAANAAYGSPRMGPIFGGMLLSGKKAAESIASKLKV